MESPDPGAFPSMVPIGSKNAAPDGLAYGRRHRRASYRCRELCEAALTLRDAALLFAELVVPMPRGTPLHLPLVAKHEAWPDDVGVPFSVLHDAGLCDNPVLPEFVSAQRSALSSAEAASRRLVELSTIQWQSLVWWIALHAYLHGYDASLLARIRPPAWRASSLAASC
jgi:hypothetical protein